MAEAVNVNKKITGIKSGFFGKIYDAIDWKSTCIKYIPNDRFESPIITRLELLR